MKKFVTLLLVLALLLCGCAPFESETTTSDAGDANPPASDNKNPIDENNPTNNLPCEGGYDPNGWT